MRISLSKQTKPKCTACYEEGNYRSIRLRCQHHYCHVCLNRMYDQAATAERVVPPRCCREIIPLEYVRQALSPEELQPFMARIEALEGAFQPWRRCPSCQCIITLSSHRIPSSSRSTVKCPSCKVGRLCAGCGEAPHKGSERCDSQRVFELAGKQQWQRCPHCGSLVEKNVGCNHMLCVCGGSFCYRCGKKRCRCYWRRLVCC